MSKHKTHIVTKSDLYKNIMKAVSALVSFGLQHDFEIDEGRELRDIITTIGGLQEILANYTCEDFHEYFVKNADFQLLLERCYKTSIKARSKKKVN